MRTPSRDAPRSDAAIVAIIITPQSPVHIQLPPLVLAGSKSGYRRVIERAKTNGSWLSSFERGALQRLGDFVSGGGLSDPFSGASWTDRNGAVRSGRFRQKLSPISDSRAAWVIGCCEHFGLLSSQGCSRWKYNSDQTMRPTATTKADR